MPIDQKTDELLQKLRQAICDCLCSEEMEQTVKALERSGYRVFVSLDAVLQDESLDDLLREAVESAEPGPAELAKSDDLFLTKSDELFLKALHIEVDDRVNR